MQSLQTTDIIRFNQARPESRKSDLQRFPSEWTSRTGAERKSSSCNEGGNEDEGENEGIGPSSLVPRCNWKPSRKIVLCINSRLDNGAFSSAYRIITGMSRSRCRGLEGEHWLLVPGTRAVPEGKVRRKKGQRRVDSEGREKRSR